MVNMVPKHLRSASGVYIIETIDGEPIYIGSTSRYSLRFYTHIGRIRAGSVWGLFAEYLKLYSHTNLLYKVYKECPLSDLHKEEKLAITLIQPLTNIHWNKRNIKGRNKKSTPAAKIEQDLHALRVAHLLKSYENYRKRQPALKRADSKEWIAMMKHYRDGTEVTHWIYKPEAQSQAA